ncbi:MAG TPA: molybdopterin-dependent oxidoreductase [Thermoanaerobaculia bacterium]|nr:molybdopterin-dependent oxidoreductase [Thermoanaerobaculia bacterium]
MRLRVALAGLLLAPILVAADGAAPVLVLPGHPDAAVTPAGLLAAGAGEVEVDGPQGTIVYRGRPLLEVLEKAGLVTAGMPNERKLAPDVVVASGRDGYTVAFSVGELTMHRADPRVYLVAETAQGPLPADQGPVRLIVVGQRARSAYGLAKIEVRSLGTNAAKKP